MLYPIGLCEEQLFFRKSSVKLVSEATLYVKTVYCSRKRSRMSRCSLG
jgi:hypothetical protein